MKRISLLFLIAILTIITCSCSAGKENDYIYKTKFMLDTIITIQLYDTKDESVLNGCFELCKKYENMFSKTIPESDIARINSSHGKTVTISDETSLLIQKSLEASEISNGAFDITISPLVDLWDVKNNPGIVPSQEEIDAELTHVNYKNITLDGNKITLKDANASIDLGAVAKGYIADKIKEFLLKNKVQHAIINLGGNVLTVGSKPDGTSFKIGIQKPFSEQNEVIASVPAIDKSVVSSGIYERYFKVDDKIYHHIINPKTGYPYDNNLLEVTILSDQSVDGDILSTTCFALDLEKGMELINSLPDTEALFITKDYELHYSDNFPISEGE